MRPLFRAITWREAVALGWRRAREWWRDRMRGYTDADVATAKAKLWDEEHMPFGLIQLTRGEMMATLDLGLRARLWNAGARVADDSCCECCGKRGVRGYCGNCQ